MYHSYTYNKLVLEDAALMTNDDIMRWLERTADVLRENRTYLTELDAAIGDADHGINMDRGFSAIRKCA